MACAGSRIRLEQELPKNFREESGGDKTLASTLSLSKNDFCVPGTARNRLSTSSG